MLSTHREMPPNEKDLGCAFKREGLWLCLQTRTWAGGVDGASKHHENRENKGAQLCARTHNLLHGHAAQDIENMMMLMLSVMCVQRARLQPNAMALGLTNLQ